MLGLERRGSFTHKGNKNEHPQFEEDWDILNSKFNFMTENEYFYSSLIKILKSPKFFFGLVYKTPRRLLRSC